MSKHIHHTLFLPLQLTINSRAGGGPQLWYRAWDKWHSPTCHCKRKVGAATPPTKISCTTVISHTSEEGSTTDFSNISPMRGNTWQEWSSTAEKASPCSSDLCQECPWPQELGLLLMSLHGATWALWAVVNIPSEPCYRHHLQILLTQHWCPEWES